MFNVNTNCMGCHLKKTLSKGHAVSAPVRRKPASPAIRPSTERCSRTGNEQIEKEVKEVEEVETEALQALEAAKDKVPTATKLETGEGDDCTKGRGLSEYRPGRQRRPQQEVLDHDSRRSNQPNSRTPWICWRAEVEPDSEGVRLPDPRQWRTEKERERSDMNDMSKVKISRRNVLSGGAAVAGADCSRRASE